MPDITLCPGHGCPIREQCRRYTARGGEMQSWFTEVPGWWVVGPDRWHVNPNGVSKWHCEYHLQIREGE